jgi:hypothetical protein
MSLFPSVHSLYLPSNPLSLFPALYLTLSFSLSLPPSLYLLHPTPLPSLILPPSLLLSSSSPSSSSLHLRLAPPESQYSTSFITSKLDLK